MRWSVLFGIFGVLIVSLIVVIGMQPSPPSREMMLDAKAQQAFVNLIRDRGYSCPYFMSAYADTPDQLGNVALIRCGESGRFRVHMNMQTLATKVEPI